MLRGNDDIDRVLEIARRYNVRVFLSPRFPLFRNTEFLDSRGLKTRQLPALVSDGPTYHYCDVNRRAVWFDNLDPTVVETHLHEVCHCIMQPPGGDIEQLSEDVLLMPFERMVARQSLSWGGYKRVIHWQEGTQIEWYDPRLKAYYSALEDVPNYERRGLWRESFDGLRRMGVVRNGRVTWQKPDWRKAPKDLMLRGNLLT